MLMRIKSTVIERKFAETVSAQDVAEWKVKSDSVMKRGAYGP